MIDPEIRDIITPQLEEDETLLWAQQTDEKLREEQIQLYTVKKKPLKITAIIVIILSLILAALFPEFRSQAIIIICLCAPFLFLKNDFRHFYAKYLHRQEVKGYALTSQRLTELDPNFEISREWPVQDIASFSEGTWWIDILPKGKMKWLKRSSMHFLRNNYAIVRSLNAKISELES